MMKGGIAEKVFQYRHGNVCKRGFLSIWICLLNRIGKLKFYDKQGRDTASIKDAASLSFDFFTWGMEPNGIMVTLHHPKISIVCFKSIFYGYIACF